MHPSRRILPWYIQFTSFVSKWRAGLDALKTDKFFAKGNSDHHKFCYDMEVVHRIQTNLATKVITIQVTSINECSLE